MDSILAVGVSLFLSNFAWQGVTRQRWAVAWERTYFQLIAVAIYVFIARAGAQ